MSKVMPGDRAGWAHTNFPATSAPTPAAAEAMMSRRVGGPCSRVRSMSAPIFVAFAARISAKRTIRQFIRNFYDLSSNISFYQSVPPAIYALP